MKPQILDEFPENSNPSKNSLGGKFITNNQNSIFANTITYIRDCESNDRNKIEEGLKKFSEHYNNFNSGFPNVLNAFFNPYQNEVIGNLNIAINNALGRTEEKLISLNNTNLNFYGF